jgi:hypothetical protein
VFDKFIETLKGAAAAITSTDEQGDIATVPDRRHSAGFEETKSSTSAKRSRRQGGPKEVGTRRSPKERYRKEGCEEKEGKEASR